MSGGQMPAAAMDHIGTSRAMRAAAVESSHIAVLAGECSIENERHSGHDRHPSSVEYVTSH
jgi:hypothetical protein